MEEEEQMDKEITDVNWKTEIIFNSIKEFKENYDLTKYSKYSINRPSMGVKKIFHCRNHTKCRFRLQIFFPSFSEDIIVQNNGFKHDHSMDGSHRFNSSLVLKEINNEIRRPTIQLVRDLRRKNIYVTPIQVTNFNQRIKKKANPRGNMDFMDLYNWAAEKSVVPTFSLLDTPFVVYKEFENNTEF